MVPLKDNGQTRSGMQETITLTVDLTPFPAIPEALLTALKRRFPDRCPEVAVPLDEVRARAGEQRVIQFLELELQHQQEESNVLRLSKSEG